MTPVLSLPRLAATLGALLLLPAAQANAASVQAAEIFALPHGSNVAKGTLTLTLTSSTAATLKSSGITVQRVGSAKVKGRSSTLKAATASVVDPITMRGTLQTGGGILFAGPKGGVKLTKLTLVRTSTGAKLNAIFDGKQVTFGTVRGGTARTAGAKGVLSGGKLVLDSTFRSQLRQATGKSLSGTFATIKAVATTRQLPITSGTATITLDPAIQSLLTAGGVTVSVKAPATYDAATGKGTLKIAGAALDPQAKEGRIALDGTLVLTSPTAKVELSAWAGILSATQKDLFASITPGLSPALATFDASTATIGGGTAAGGPVTFSGLKLRFSSLAITSIKAQLGLTIDPNTPFGTVDLAGTWGP